MKKLAAIFLLFTLSCNVPKQEFSGSKSIDLNNAFKNYWHTVEDTPENCSPESLGQVGMLMVDYIFNRKFYTDQ